MATKITEHFDYEPFWDNSSTAKKYHIDNQPTESARNNIYKIVTEILEKIAIRWGKPIRVNSSYRCPKLNSIVGGAKGSQHLTGAAVDIATRGGSNGVLFKLILEMIRNKEIVVGQLIWEHGSDINPKWIHISLPYSKRNDILRCYPNNKYVKFNEPVPSGKDVINTPVDSSYPIPPQEDNYEYQETDWQTNTNDRDGVQIISTKKSLNSKRKVTNDYKKTK